MRGIRYVVRTVEHAKKLGYRLEKHVLDGRELLVQVADYVPPKTHAQNSKLHALFTELALQIDGTKSEVKSYFKDLYGPKVNVMGRKVNKSVADYTREECSEMIEHVYHDAAEAGYELE